MSNMYPFTHPTGACNSGVIRARESRRLTSGTAAIWTLSGIVLAACNHSSSDNPVTAATPGTPGTPAQPAQPFRAAVWVSDPGVGAAVNLEFAYGDTNPTAPGTRDQNQVLELHITPGEIIDTAGNTKNTGSDVIFYTNPVGSTDPFTNAAASGTITATNANGDPVPGELVLVRPVESVGDGIITRVDPNVPPTDSNVVQWGYTPSFPRDMPGAGAEAIYRSITFRFEPNDPVKYASPTIIMTFKIGGSQPVLNPVLRSEDTEFTITLDGLAPTTGTFDASGKIDVVVDGVDGNPNPIAGAGQFIVTSSLGRNEGNTMLNNDGGYYGAFSINDNTGDWNYIIDDFDPPPPILLATTGGRPLTETISITYVPNVEGGVRLYQESNTIDLVFNFRDLPASNFVSEAYIDDTPTPDAPPALDVL